MANGNFYHSGLGSKKHPLHLLIPHGAFQIRNLPTLKHNDLLSWFEGCREGKIEGIVWHCNDGCLIKVMAENSWRNYVVLFNFLISETTILYMIKKCFPGCFHSLGHWFSQMCFRNKVMKTSGKIAYYRLPSWKFMLHLNAEIIYTNLV